MWEVVVGVGLTAILTALFGGLLVPSIRAGMDRRREQCTASAGLLETFAASLWTYWKFAMRVAYYGRNETDDDEGYTTALERWDSDHAWTNGCEIQIQVSRSKRLLPKATHTQLAETQYAVVEDLDLWVDHLRAKKEPQAWGDFYTALTGDKRRQIEEMLARLDQHLAWEQRSRAVHVWRRLQGKTPPDIKLDPGFVVGPPRPAEPDAGSRVAG
jgi:hypothetical protein